MKIDLSGKVAVVTGGAMGIGEACARKIALAGASVAILDPNEDAGTKTAAAIRAHGGECKFFRCDVSKSKDVEQAVGDVITKHSQIDILVSNAGIQYYGDVITTPEDDWDRVIGVNLKGCFLISKFCVPHMISNGGAIVVLGSVQSFTAIQNSAAYVTSKHAVLGLARAMALDYAHKGIRVNCVCPGTIDTPMLHWAASLSPDPESVIRTCDRMHALGRIGKPDEVADAVLYLASPMSSFITGAALLVDGGMLVPAGGMAFQEGGTGASTKK
ncbi:short-chain dehydrogenase/reductase SDR [Candidatus Koribacter versatilis Ellin345]|uniref:Short-chain dehydrogenase/reductase SDR n=1 Tax=Koribacter versatilis (strain Ellin345) TaxID=204669 RepID=Q1IU02_KORVE|nr:SDR family oxidoreductase [Candidatus Koribacter versatilis]ABF39648.1 short-chain dehydrogenase/reductase SDR [Candidatus Koribacter versatilis Ellin345]